MDIYTLFYLLINTQLYLHTVIGQLYSISLTTSPTVPSDALNLTRVRVVYSLLMWIISYSNLSDINLNEYTLDIELPTGFEILKNLDEHGNLLIHKLSKSTVDIFPAILIIPEAEHRKYQPSPLFYGSFNFSEIWVANSGAFLSDHNLIFSWLPHHSSYHLVRSRFACLFFMFMCHFKRSAH